MKKPSVQYIYKALVTNVVDGDTFDAKVSLGYNIQADIRFRVKNYNAPESFRPKTEEEKVRGIAAKKTAIDLLLDTEVTIQSLKEAVYNRWEAVITLPDGRDYVSVMTGMGHVK